MDSTQNSTNNLKKPSAFQHLISKLLLLQQIMHNVSEGRLATAFSFSRGDHVCGGAAVHRGGVPRGQTGRAFRGTVLFCLLGSAFVALAVREESMIYSAFFWNYFRRIVFQCNTLLNITVTLFLNPSTGDSSPPTCMFDVSRKRARTR